MRQSVLKLQHRVVSDPYFQNFPSLKKTAVAFHAKDDVPEIRYEVYKLLRELPFKAQFIVARKIERVFRNNFDARESLFYDHLVTHLFENVLHRYRYNTIFFAKRGSRDRQKLLMDAIRRGVEKFEGKWQTTVSADIKIMAQTPKGEPVLSVIDYMNWAVYRAFTRREMRYFNAVRDKVSLLVDLYDTSKYPNNWYSRRKNPFDAKKITPL